MNRIRLTALAVIATAVALAGALLAPTAAGASTSCSQVWGSLPESRAASTNLQVTDVRSGSHACFDRLVIDLRGPARPVSYDVRYVSAVVADQGVPLSLRGGADIKITLGAPAYDEQGNATYVPASRTDAVSVSGYPTFRQVRWAGSFEGKSTIGLGVRARLPFRTFTLLGSSGDDGAVRLVIDVAHSW
jgi:hypothetical protein